MKRKEPEAKLGTSSELSEWDTLQKKEGNEFIGKRERELNLKVVD